MYINIYTISLVYRFTAYNVKINVTSRNNYRKTFSKCSRINNLAHLTQRLTRDRHPSFMVSGLFALITHSPWVRLS